MMNNHDIIHRLEQAVKYHTWQLKKDNSLLLCTNVPYSII